MQKQITLGNILSEYGEDYITRHELKGQAKGIIRLLPSCQTPALGKHYQKCSECSYYDTATNSCRNRNCPLCQQKDKQQWLDKRMKELLPVGYYHLVFTIPHELNPLCLQNKKVMYRILFKAASETILELTKDTKHLGADTGLISVLHTWGQNMMEHPHLHTIMPAGGLSFDKEHWIHTDKKNKFFIHHKIISAKFKGKFMDFTQQAYEKKELSLKGDNASLNTKYKWNAFKEKLYKKNWVVNIQPPFGSPEKVLEYLSRYVFRIAITNRRIIEVKDGKVLFSWKDYRSGHFRKMRLEIDEFIRRFLLHILPQGFFKVRYYGIFTNRYRKENIQNAKKLLKQEQELRLEEAIEDGKNVLIKRYSIWDELLKTTQEYRKPNCPCCKKGYLHFAGIVPADNRAPE